MQREEEGKNSFTEAILGRARRYLYSNLYLFLPSVLILVLLPLLYAFFEPCWRTVSTDVFAACDSSYGGGSRNLCENNIWFSALLSALGVATALALPLVTGLIRLLHIDWLSPLYGIGLFYGIPFLFYVVHLILTAGTYGTERGKINDGIITIGIPVLVVLAVVLSYINYRGYREWGSEPEESHL
jgi:hypothetical protein